jgi:hypothetical protein
MSDPNGERPRQPGAPHGVPQGAVEPTARLDFFDSAFARDRAEPPAAGEADAVDAAQPPQGPVADDERRKRMLPPLVLAGLAVVLNIGAYGVGRAFSSQLGAPGGGEAAAGSEVAGGGADVSDAERYAGAVTAVDVAGATASCQSDSSVDAAGNPVTYEPGNAVDARASTAWRCAGDGHGARLTLDLGSEVPVGEVGMVPGYAKTDATSGADRYAENNRITRARWIFDDGSSFVQDLDGAKKNRSMQTMRVPKTTTRRVVIEILDSAPGPRNTVAISEVQISSADPS